MSFKNIESKFYTPSKNLTSVEQLIDLLVNFSYEYNKLFTSPNIESRILAYLQIINTTLVNNLNYNCGIPVLSYLHGSIDTLFIIMSGCIIILMMGGFVLMEAGLIRIHTFFAVVIGNAIQLMIGGFAYITVGFGITWGEDILGYVGTSLWFLLPSKYSFKIHSVVSTKQDSDKFLDKNLHYPGMQGFSFYLAQSITYLFILMSVGVGRVTHITMCLQGFIIGGIVYPLMSHWCYHWEGWMRSGVEDYVLNDRAGGALLHASAGAAALAAALVLGKRKISYTSSKYYLPSPMGPALCVMGYFMLIIAYIIKNGASNAKVSPKCSVEHIGLSILNTLMGCIGGGLSPIILFVMVYRQKIETYAEMTRIITCSLAGEIAVSAGCHTSRPLYAFLSSIVAGILCFIWAEYVKDNYGIEDPIDSTSGHFLPGIWSSLITPFINYKMTLKSAIKIFSWNLFCVLYLSTFSFSIVWGLYSILDFYYLLRKDTEQQEHAEAVNDFKLRQQFGESLPKKLYEGPIDFSVKKQHE